LREAIVLIRQVLVAGSTCAVIIAAASGPVLAAPDGDLATSAQRLEDIHRVTDGQVDQYAGMALDEHTKVLTVYVTRGQRSVASRSLRNQFQQADGDLHVKLVEVAHSTRELTAIMRAVESAEPWASTVRETLSNWYPDYRTNTVHVGLTTVTAQARAAASAVFGDRVVLEQQPRFNSATKSVPFNGKVVTVPSRSKKTGPSAGASIAPSPGRLLDATPYWGGDRIVRFWTDSSGQQWITQCTVAVRARSNNSSTYYMMTAGHCGPTGSVWRQGYLETDGTVYVTGLMGNAASTQWGNNLIDAQIIYSGSTYDSYVYNQPITGVLDVGSATPTVGQYACFDGSVSNYGSEDCSSTILTTNGCVNVGNENGGSYHVCGQATAGSNTNTICHHGDSGGPVLNYGTGHYPAFALGIISSVNSAFTICSFTQMPNAVSTFGVTVL